MLWCTPGIDQLHAQKCAEFQCSAHSLLADGCKCELCGMRIVLLVCLAQESQAEIKGLWDSLDVQPKLMILAGLSSMPYLPLWLFVALIACLQRARGKRKRAEGSGNWPCCTRVPLCFVASALEATLQLIQLAISSSSLFGAAQTALALAADKKGAGAGCLGLPGALSNGPRAKPMAVFSVGFARTLFTYVLSTPAHSYQLPSRTTMPLPMRHARLDCSM